MRYVVFLVGWVILSFFFPRAAFAQSDPSPIEEGISLFVESPALSGCVNLQLPDNIWLPPPFQFPIRAHIDTNVFDKSDLFFTYRGVATESWPTPHEFADSGWGKDSVTFSIERAAHIRFTVTVRTADGARMGTAIINEDNAVCGQSNSYCRPGFEIVPSRHVAFVGIDEADTITFRPRVEVLGASDLAANWYVAWDLNYSDEPDAGGNGNDTLGIEDFNASFVTNSGDRSFRYQFVREGTYTVAAMARPLGLDSHPICSAISAATIQVHRVNVDILDPVAELLDDDPASVDDITVDRKKLASLGRAVRGIAADGAAKLLVRLQTLYPLKGGVNFSLVGALGTIGDVEKDGSLNSVDHQAGVPSGSLTVPIEETSGVRRAFAIYNAPLDFVRPGTGDMAQKQREIALKIALGNVLNLTHTIEIHRPMVYCLHGVWSGPSVWYDFRPLVFSRTVWDPRFTIRFGDYEAGNARPISGNTFATINDLSYWLYLYKRDEQIASVRADVVSHSMGGLITRALPVYAATRYFSRMNYRKGLVHKLITFDTPHLGTELADMLIRKMTTGAAGPTLTAARNQILQSALGLVTDNAIDGGAVSDMQTTSPVIAMLMAPNNVVNEAPIHRIECNAAPGGKLLWDKVVRTLAQTGIESVFGGVPHDLLVSSASQRFQALPPANDAGAITFFDGPVHFSGLPESIPVVSTASGTANLAITLLNAPRNSTYFSDNGRQTTRKGDDDLPIVLSMAEGFEKFFVVPTNRSMQEAQGVDAVSITAPMDGASYTIGQTVDVEVAIDPGFSITRVTLVGLGYVEIDSIPPYAFRYTIPDGARLGPLELIAVGERSEGNDPVDSLGNRLYAVTRVNVETDETLIGIEAGSEDTIVFRPGLTERSLRVYGRYGGDLERDITFSPQTTFASSNPGVATTEPGKIVAGAPGTAVIVIGRSGFVDSVVAIVEAGNRPPIARSLNDTSVTSGAVVELDASASYDPDGDPITYSWTLLARPEGSAAVLADPASSATSLLCDSAGYYLVLVTVTDTAGNTNWSQTIVAALPDTASGVGSVGRRVENLPFTVSPNPAGDDVALSFTISDSRHVRLAAFDVNGKSVATLADRRYPQGTHTLYWRTENLPSGVYFLHLVADSERRLQIVVVDNQMK